MMDTPSGRFRRQNKNSPGGHKCLRENLFIGSVVRENAQRFADVEEHRRKNVCMLRRIGCFRRHPSRACSHPGEQPVSTGCTFCGPLVALCQKHLAGGGIKQPAQLCNVLSPQVSTRPGHKNRRDKDFRHPLLQDSVHRSRRMHRRSAAFPARCADNLRNYGC